MKILKANKLHTTADQSPSAPWHWGGEVSLSLSL